jgi:hypothetical protein
MRFDGIIEVDKSGERCLAFLSVSKGLLSIPHFHEGTDNALCLTIGLWSCGSGEFLPDVVCFAGSHEAMVVIAFEFPAIILSQAHSIV